MRLEAANNLGCEKDVVSEETEPQGQIKDDWKVVVQLSPVVGVDWTYGVDTGKQGNGRSLNRWVISLWWKSFCCPDISGELVLPLWNQGN